MPIKIVRNDITKIECDVIVNAANSSLLGGGGVDGAIHRAAGRGLFLECIKLGGCKVGQAKITEGYKLPCKYIIHTVGPKWKDGNHGEKELLESCYYESLKLAVEYNCDSIAFPLISSGIYGYPKDQALRVAVDSITQFLLRYDMLVYIVVFDKTAFRISEKLFLDISSYIDDKYVDTHFEFNRTYRDEWSESKMSGETSLFSDSPLESTVSYQQSMKIPKSRSVSSVSMEDMETARPLLSENVEMPKALSLEDMMNQMDESFSQMLLRKIDEKGMKDAECYKKANIDRKLFSKIRNNIQYKPSKTTAIAFSIALELSLDETKDFLMKAGYALSHSSKFDIIIEYFIANGNYNIFEINEALFAFDQSLLGV